jgi:hypothetical protein
MDDSWRERREAELRVMQHNDPRGLIELYCKIAGETASSQMPRGVSFSRMIDTIIDQELQSASARQATT